MKKSAAVLCLLLTVLWSWACGEPGTIRLIDRFSDATVENLEGNSQRVPRTEWRFPSSESVDSVWTVAQDIENLRVEAGFLVGRSSGAAPVLQLERTEGLESGDHLYSVEVRLQVDSGEELAMRSSGSETVNLRQVLGAGIFGWPLSSPLVTGDEARTYVLRPVQPIPAASLRHLFLRPTDIAEAAFRIESIRLIFEREHLSSVPSGVTWQGMGNIYKESIVARSPQTVLFEVDLPEAPMLDLSIGTLEAGAVTFGIEVTRDGETVAAIERTVTTPQRWESFDVPLFPWGGSRVEIALSVEAGVPGMLGLWGAPAVRSTSRRGLRRAHGEGDAPQGVIVIVGDTLRRDHLSMADYSRETSPTLIRLAREGVWVEDAISQATWTKVSVPSIFTSLYPTSHGVASVADALPASATTMAEVFRDAGYATLGLSSIPFTGKLTNLHQGYEEFHESSSLNSEGLKTAREYLDRLLPWLDRHRDTPFFVFLHLADPHSPYVAPIPYDKLWGEDGDPDRMQELLERVRPEIQNPLMRRFGMPESAAFEASEVDPETFVRYELDAYDGLIRSMDSEIRRLVEKLEELELRDRVVLAFVSDHGTEFLEHDQHFHGQSVYGELNRVPLFFWGPGFVPSGVRVPATVQNIDLMPTVLDLSGLLSPAEVQGQSLRPWFEAAGDAALAADKGWRRRPAITEKAKLQGGMPGRTYESIAIIYGGWKLIQNVDPPEGVPEVELYDHVADPINLQDLAGQNPDRVEQLLDRIEAWRKFAQEHQLKTDAELEQELNAEELERLRSLGYL